MPILRVPKHQLSDKIGYQFKPSAWVTLSQERINAFADCTEDHQFIHIDKEKAASTPLGGTIAHGFLTLSLLAEMSKDCGLEPINMRMALNYGLDRVRFLAPVRAGKRVRAHYQVTDVRDKGDNRYLIKYQVRVEIEGEETPALVAESLLMTFAD